MTNRQGLAKREASHAFRDHRGRAARDADGGVCIRYVGPGGGADLVADQQQPRVRDEGRGTKHGVADDCRSRLDMLH